ncbi:MAG: glycosyltransferase family 39 protein [Taibaiella sp.]|nr:glycosyltransferase family 39 protein [Taibaiella sp.]
MGPGFEVPLIILEKALQLTDSRTVYEARHLATHLYFLISAFCGYVLARGLFRAPALALLGYAILVFHPRIYAHSFFNSKDIPFLSAFLIAMLVCNIAVSGRWLHWYLAAGAAVAYASSIRVIGVTLTGGFMLYLLVDWFTSAGSTKATAMRVVTFFMGFAGVLYLCWPLLWRAPVTGFINSTYRLKTIPWGGVLLYKGASYTEKNLPAGYLPSWFSISMPELWLLTGLLGIIWLLINFLKQPAVFLKTPRDRMLLIYIICFFLPPVALAAMRAAVIDDWRHLYFIYPLFVMLALYAVERCAQYLKTGWLATLFAVQFAFVAQFFFTAHPYQQVYFNFLVPHRAEYFRTNYDYEYWGCAYREALLYILAHDTAAQVRVYGLEDLVKNAITCLPPNSRNRAVHVWKDERPDYFITNFRGHPEDFPLPELYKIKVQNSTVVAVYKMPASPPVQ